jgi:glycosyltransferase involved in cell wall biosynthesis
MTWRRRLRLARSAGVDARLVSDAARVQRKRGHDARLRLGITYPLREGAEEERQLARGIAGAFPGWTTFLLPVVGYALRPRSPDIDALLMLAPIDHSEDLPASVVRVAWLRTRVRDWPAPCLESADLVLAASRALADDASAQLRVAVPVVYPAVALEDAPSGDRDVRLAYSGDAGRAADRLARLIDPRVATELRVFGRGWTSDRRFATLAAAPESEDLTAVHGRSRLVLGLRDATRRSLDPALMRAALRGALPITDDFESATTFTAPLSSFADRQELGDLVAGLDETRRAAMVAELRATIAAEHTYGPRAAQIARLIEAERSKLRIAITICPPGVDVMERWGDTHFARQLAAALRRRGFRPDVRIRPDWHRTAPPPDVVIHLRGLEAYHPQPGPLNLLWVISHPETVTEEECEQYDAVFVASAQFSADLAARVSAPVHTMLQAADPDVFRYGPADPARRSEVLFVGNSRLPVRQVPRWLLELEAPLTIYGARWDELDERRFVRGDFVANEDLHALYRAADIVVNDHWADMRSHGFISNRVFDALACGAFIISDHVDAIPDVFGEAVPTFSDKAELAAVLARFQADPVERAERALTGRRIVLDGHTFDARAEQIGRVVERLRP